MSFTLNEKDVARFWDKVKLPDNDDCMLWRVSCDNRGYGQFSLGSRKLRTHRVVKAHQVSWFLAYGELPFPLEPDHTCSNPRCVNPDHLEWVAHAENIRRFSDRMNACRAGHPRVAGNISVRPNGTHITCLECRRERRRNASSK